MASNIPVDHRSSVSSTNPTATVAVDRISNLPESLSYHILSSLTTKETVATSILSRSWRPRWTHVTRFDFDNSSERSSQNQVMDFADIIDRVLASHSGEPISQFVVAGKPANFRPDHLNKWVDIAIARNVRVLDLVTYPQSSECEFPLPPSLYTHEILEVLRLCGPFLVELEPPTEVSFPRLAEMTLNKVIYESDESFSKLISASPILRSLKISRLKSVRDNLVVCLISSPVLKTLFIDIGQDGTNLEPECKLKIEAPALQILDLKDKVSSHISIEPRPYLPFLEVVVFDLPYETSAEMIAGLFRSIRSVVALSLSAQTMINLDNPRLAPLPIFRRLGKLIIYQNHMGFWRILMSVLDGCIRIKELAISLVPSSKMLTGHKFLGAPTISFPTFLGKSWSHDPHRVPRCLELGVRCLTLAGFDGGNDHMALLDMFLAICFGLRRVNICCAEEIYEKRFQVLDKLSRLPKSSHPLRFFLPDPSEVNKIFLYTED